MSHRIMTVPNAISLLRLLGVPLFLWLLLVQELDVAAFLVLVAGGVSDWLDGYLARRLDQQSPVGEVLDLPVSEVEVVYRSCPILQTHLALGATLRGQTCTAEEVPVVWAGRV